MQNKKVPQNNFNSKQHIPMSHRIIIKAESTLRKSVQAAGGFVNITVLLLIVSGIVIKTYAYFNP